VPAGRLRSTCQIRPENESARRITPGATTQLPLRPRASSVETELWRGHLGTARRKGR
jgi:hypothetical protein